MYYSPLPAPIALGMCGALVGLIAGGFNQCFPIWVGAATGGSVGCAACIFLGLMPEPPVQPLRVATEPIIVIQNIYITGEAKEIPIAKIVDS